MPGRSSRRSARPTTGSARRSRSGRTRAGAGSSSRACPRTAGTCSTSRRAPASSPRRSLARGFRVTGLDQSAEMLALARKRFGDRVELVEASADALPFPDASFDHLTFTYLLRYVDDPAATMRELARVVRPGGTIAMLEFGVAERRLAAALGPLGRRRAAARRPAHLARVARGRPLPRAVDPRVPRRLPGAGARRPCGGTRASQTSASRRLSLGGGVVMWGRRERVVLATRATASGGAPRRRSTPCGPAAGGTTSPCSTCRTRPGTCRTSSSARASRPRSTGRRSRGRCSPSPSRWESARTPSTSSTAGRCGRRSPRAVLVVARDRVRGGRVRDRDRRRARADALDPPARRRRRRARARLQPRAARRQGAHRPRLRALVGGVSRCSRRTSRRRGRSGSRPVSRRRGRRCSRSPSAASRRPVRTAAARRRRRSRAGSCSRTGRTSRSSGRRSRRPPRPRSGSSRPSAVLLAATLVALRV